MEGVITASAAGLELRGLEDFEAVVEAHQRQVYRLLLGMLSDPEAAENLTQDCFLRAYRARASYRGQASVTTWLLKIAVNLARDYTRSRRLGFWKRLVGLEGEVEDRRVQAADRHASPERALLAREELRGVWAAVETLSARQRAVFVLRFVEEMTLEEIAQATGMKAGTVKTHLARALGAVRKKARHEGVLA